MTGIAVSSDFHRDIHLKISWGVFPGVGTNNFGLCGLSSCNMDIYFRSMVKFREGKYGGNARCEETYSEQTFCGETNLETLFVEAYCEETYCGEAYCDRVHFGKAHCGGR